MAFTSKTNQKSPYDMLALPELDEQPDEHSVTLTRNDWDSVLIALARMHSCSNNSMLYAEIAARILKALEP